ncbi:MAG: muconate cycloisomerase [Roseovarius sp.]|nr:muconate cycloisomerase [Roseovarius sp.]
MGEMQQTITGYDLWHLELPVAAVRSHGVGQMDGSCEIIVLRLMAEGGDEGWGEAAPWSVFTGSPEASYAALDRYIRPFVTGRKVCERERIMAEAQYAVAHCSEAKAALETALLDLEGQISGRPVHALLGGRKCENIPLSVSLANPDWDADIDLLARLREEGVGIVKLKTGFSEHEFDLMRLESLRSDWTDFSVRVDYNQALKPDEALRQVREIELFLPDFIEQPVERHAFGAMARLRSEINVPLLADESVFGPEDMENATSFGICDGVSVKIMKAGGLRRARKVARMASANGLAAYGGDMFESGLAHLAGAHMIAATPEISLGCEFYQARYYLAEDILEMPFPCSRGVVEIPDKPGLGIRPDMGKLEFFSRDR